MKCHRVVCAANCPQAQREGTGILCRIRWFSWIPPERWSLSSPRTPMCPWDICVLDCNKWKIAWFYMLTSWRIIDKSVPAWVEKSGVKITISSLLGLVLSPQPGTVCAPGCINVKHVFTLMCSARRSVALLGYGVEVRGRWDCEICGFEPAPLKGPSTQKVEGPYTGGRK